MNEQDLRTGSAFGAIRAIDHTVIFVRDMDAMRWFCENIMRFPLQRELSSNWIEYRIGGNTLVLSRPGLTAFDSPTPFGSAALHLAFKVSAREVDQCAEELLRTGVSLLSPPTDRDFGHRTLFFRDPDGNLLEMFAEIQGRAQKPEWFLCSNAAPWSECISGRSRRDIDVIRFPVSGQDAAAGSAPLPFSDC